MKKTILSVFLGITSLAHLSCFSSLFYKMKRGYIQQQLQPQPEREQKIRSDIQQLRSEGKTSEEIQTIYTFERETPEQKAYAEAAIQAIKKEKETKKARKEYILAKSQNLPSQTTLKDVLNQKEQEKSQAWKKWGSAYKEERKTPEYRIAYPQFAIPTTKPTTKLDFYTGKPTGISSKPISQDSFWNRFWKALGY